MSELIQNGTFDIGSTNWTFTTNGTGNLTTTNGIAKITVTNVGTDTRLYQDDIVLEPDTDYLFKFDYGTTGSGIPIQVSLTDNNSPNTEILNWSPTSPVGGGTVNHYFRTSETVPDDTRLTFTINTATKYYLDNISLDIGTPPPGSASFTSNPSAADIWIDDVYKGISPIAISGLTTGPHNYKLSLAEYAEVTGTLFITSDTTTTVPTIIFPGSVNITSTPSGAEIFLGPHFGTLADINVTTDSIITNLTSASSGATAQYDYKLTLSGYTDSVGTFTAIAGSIIDISTYLVPLNISELIRNGTFDTDSSNWTFTTDGVGNLAIDNGIAVITVTNVGTDTRFYQDGIVLEPDTDYLFKFDYGTTGSGIPIQVSLTDNNSPNTEILNWSPTSPVGGGTVNHYFRTSEIVPDDTRLTFTFVTATKYYIDNISLDVGTPPPPPPITPPIGLDGLKGVSLGLISSLSDMPSRIYDAASKGFNFVLVDIIPAELQDIAGVNATISMAHSHNMRIHLTFNISKYNGGDFNTFHTNSIARAAAMDDIDLILANYAFDGIELEEPYRHFIPPCGNTNDPADVACRDARYAYARDILVPFYNQFFADINAKIGSERIATGFSFGFNQASGLSDNGASWYLMGNDVTVCNNIFTHFTIQNAVENLQQFINNDTVVRSKLPNLKIINCIFITHTSLIKRPECIPVWDKPTCWNVDIINQVPWCIQNGKSFLIFVQERFYVPRSLYPASAPTGSTIGDILKTILVTSTILTVDKNDCMAPCTVGGTVKWTNYSNIASNPMTLGITVNGNLTVLDTGVIINPGETTSIYQFSLLNLDAGTYTIESSPNTSSSPQIITVRTPPNVISATLTIETNDCTAPCTINGTVSWTNNGDTISDPMDLGITVNDIPTNLATDVIINTGETTLEYPFTLSDLLADIYNVCASPDSGTTCQIINVKTPANIVCTTIVPSTTSCTEPCNMTVDITWLNTGESSGTFIPTILIDASPSSISSETLDPEAYITKTFSLAGLIAGPHTICASPDSGATCQIVNVKTPADIIATNITLNPYACTEICDISIDVIYMNAGQTSGSFTPEIKIDNESVILAPDTLDSGLTIIKTFTLTDKTAGTYTICTVPLGATICQTLTVNAVQEAGMGGILVAGLAIGALLMSGKKI